MRPVDHHLALLARDQWGTFSAGQARAVGASRSLIDRRVRSKEWVRFAEGSFGLPDWPPSFERSLFAGLHAADGRALVGAMSAAALLGVQGFPRNRLEILVPHGARNRNPIAVVRQTRRMPARQMTVRRLPCPPVERVVCEVARHVGPRRLGAVVDDLVIARRTTLPRIQREYLGLAVPAWPGYRVVAQVLAARGDEYVPTRSELERKADRILATIPGPAPRHEVSVGDRVEMPQIVDRLYVAERLIVEIDGRAWHTRVADLVRDRRRDRRAAILGYTTFRFGHEEIDHDADGVRADVMSYLGR